MSASVPKTVKVDNWGIYFLQRLKHFFNRTDYCDLTLQFQDNAQLKVHRLVLSACTEYFEVLGRTCEMYEDCLVMPDDLQADVVVPIVNFMYTGQLEFKMDILERLHACAEIMNMPVLSKLLDAHRPKTKLSFSYSKKSAKPQSIQLQQIKSPGETISTGVVIPAIRRPAANVTEKSNLQKKCQIKVSKKSPPMLLTNGGRVYQRSPSPKPTETFGRFGKVAKPTEPRPTRYELPEELDTDNLFESSFSNISYTSQPLMVHPETTKQYSKRPRQDKGLLPSTSKRFRSNTLDIVECKKVTGETGDPLFDETSSNITDDDMFRSYDNVQIKTEPVKDANKLFDQLLDQEEASPKVTIETTKKAANLDHAKIISDVLKKYPHLVKSNRNIKLKIFNNPVPTKILPKKLKPSPQPLVDNAENVKAENISDYTYETDVLDSKSAAKLIALGAENIRGPWICLICGTPGKALHFSSYYKFRRHLVEVHNEKPVLNICEYCGQRVTKRNHLLHHLYSKHGVQPPPTHLFPKCQQCNYIALNEALLIKHKLSHSDTKGFRCNVCPSTFNSSKLLLIHIQNTGHKYIADRKANHQCIYCLRVFVRENNLYAHLKTHHKAEAVKDGIIDESDEEERDEPTPDVKDEPIFQSNDYDDNMEYHIQQNANGNIQLIPKKPNEKSPLKQTILNRRFTPISPIMSESKPKITKSILNVGTENTEDDTFDHGNGDEIILIDNNEYVMSGNQLILKKPASEAEDEFILSDLTIQKEEESSPQPMTPPTTSIDYTAMINTNSNENIQQSSMTESIPIFVSNEEEYKALIASNHNIIFDSTDKSKTLTVLTTSETGGINNPGVALDNTQNNDMMIIQENYPINVSQAVVTDNPNIVVVYSQQVGDPSKGYQLLTTQAIDAQYAQTSGIITHNYETVSTASPVTTAQILETPVTTWPGVINDNINSHTTNTSAILQSIVDSGVIQVSTVEESINSINSLPVELTVDHNQPAIISQIQDTHHVESSCNTQTVSERDLVQCAQIIPMEVDNQLVVATTVSEEGSIECSEKTGAVEKIGPTENVNEIISEEVDRVPESENMSEVETEIIRMEAPISDTTEKMDIPESTTSVNIVSLDGQTSIKHDNISSMEVQPSETIITETVDTQIADVNENIEIDDVHDANEHIENVEVHAANEHIENVEVHDANEHIEDVEVRDANLEAETENNGTGPDTVQEIQTLASEWSEEDDSQSQSTTDTTSQGLTNPEVEKTIENIQRELSKHSGDSNDNAPVDEVTEPHEELPLQANIAKPDPKVKLSSLLNDWEDNDSQEDNVIVKNVPPELALDIPGTEINPIEQEASNDDTFESPESQDSSAVEEDEILENTPAEEIITETMEPVNKQDKIKSLVSDWDEDDEEEKQ